MPLRTVEWVGAELVAVVGGETCLAPIMMAIGLGYI